MAVDGSAIDEALVRRLLLRQAPQWAALAIKPVDRQGWDNRTFRLGATMSVRLPSRAVYASQIVTEATWLPVLRPHLPAGIPTTLFVGQPAEGFPWPWAVREWIEGEDASTCAIAGRDVFASDLGQFLRALQRVDATGGPRPGPHNFHRGGDPRVYDLQTKEALDLLQLGPRAAAIWERALQAPATHQVWVHGDVSPNNLLVRDGQLSAVIDFGQLAVGDPACDFAIAWTFFDQARRERFRSAAGVDDATWERGKGWALWKAVAVAAGLSADPSQIPAAQKTISELLSTP